MKYLKLYETFKEKSINDFIKKASSTTGFLEKKFGDLNAQALEAQNQNLTSLDGIEKYENLRYLNISSNHLTSLKGLENSINLVQISCRKNQLENLEALKDLINITFINCRENKLTNLYDIEDLPNLIHLICNKNPFNFPSPIKLYKYMKEASYYFRYFGTHKEMVLEDIFELDETNPYTKEQVAHFHTYAFQKFFLTKYPTKVKDLKPFIYDDEIVKEFPALIRGVEWGFFDLQEK